MSSCGDALLQRITSKEATIGIIGMGYVGLPLAIAFGEAGCRVLGFDLDNAKANDINAGPAAISSTSRAIG
jgi:UDP-N-acetyl-D-glucosamine dehydrogenase